jgi:asparagine synthase (glutamine-hydrolysing)
LTTLGPLWVLKRARFALANKLGILERRLPLRSWEDISLAKMLKAGVPGDCKQYCAWRQHNSPRFFSETFPAAQAEAIVGAGAVAIADQVLRGEFPFFGHSRKLGFPPQWQVNPLSGAVAGGGHWSRIDEFASGDIKLWWESSRFAWVFALARAYTRTRDERYAEAFWELLESWLKDNPPQWGVNWKCGQEASFRVMALCFGFHVFSTSESATAERVARFVSVIGVHADRIEAYIDYALSQKNNHGISEGTGLWTVGLLFPEFRNAARWKARGKRAIKSEVERQIDRDGSYVQHSTNYHRVMLHDLAWSLRLGECNGEALAPTVLERFRASIGFLAAVRRRITAPTMAHSSCRSVTARIQT